jgi:hypothetical protein
VGQFREPDLTVSNLEDRMTNWPDLVERIRTTHREILRIAPFRDLGLVPNPGAAPAAITLAEERLGVPLPPSYKQFLKSHDGWPRFFEGASLLGTACLGSRLYDDFARAAFAAAETPEPELGPPTRRRRYDRVVPFGVDLQSTTLFAFDTTARQANGEYEIIAWINEIGIRRDDFPSFLELLLELAEYELEGHALGAALTLRQSA